METSLEPLGGDKALSVLETSLGAGELRFADMSKVIAKVSFDDEDALFNGHMRSPTADDTLSIVSTRTKELSLDLSSMVKDGIFATGRRDAQACSIVANRGSGGRIVVVGGASTGVLASRLCFGDAANVVD